MYSEATLLQIFKQASLDLIYFRVLVLNGKQGRVLQKNIKLYLLQMISTWRTGISSP